MILAKGQLVLHFKGVLIAIEIIFFISELTLGVKIRKKSTVVPHIKEQATEI